MNVRIVTATLLSITLLTSCVNLDKLFKSDYTTRILHIPASIESIEFSDRRTNVSFEHDISLPVFSKPNQFIEFYPKFNSTHQRLVFDLIHKNFSTDSSRVVKVNVELLEGVKEFSATFARETEKVKIKLRITMVDGDAKLLGESSGEYFVSSADAKYVRFEELYQRTLQTVTYNALKEFK